MWAELWAAVFECPAVSSLTVSATDCRLDSPCEKDGQGSAASAELSGQMLMDESLFASAAPSNPFPGCSP